MNKELINRTLRILEFGAASAVYRFPNEYEEITELISIYTKILNKPVKNKKPLNPDAVNVANYLAEKIITVKENLSLNPSLWVKDIDKAIRIDKVSKTDLINTIDWIYSDAGKFWIPNIMSGKKLREKYQTLAVQIATRESVNYVNRATEPTEDEWNSTDF